LLCRDLLTYSGSVFVQIGDENLHRVRSLLDEVFGPGNFIATINFKTMMPLESGHIESVFDYLCWYARDKKALKYRNLFVEKNVGGDSEFVFADTADGGYRRLTEEEIEHFDRTATTELSLRSPSHLGEGQKRDVELAAFQPRDIGAIQSGRQGDGFLRHAGCFPVSPAG
jgi:hypothetical protein